MSAEEPNVPSEVRECYEYVITKRYDLYDDTASIQTKRDIIRHILEQQLERHDYILNLFTAYVTNVCKFDPYKPYIINAYEHQDITNSKQLLRLILCMPPLNSMIQFLTVESVNLMMPYLLDLLYWLFIIKHEPALELITSAQLEQTLQIDFKANYFNEPCHIFRINQTIAVEEEVMFQLHKRTSTTRYCFLGVAFIYIYGVIYNGLKHCIENGAMLPLTFHTCPSAVSRPAGTQHCSIIGNSSNSKIHCLAVCEIIEHHDEVQQTTNYNPSNIVFKTKNTNLVRLRYLIFYKHNYFDLLQIRKYLSLAMGNLKKFKWQVISLAALSYGFFYFK